MANFNWKLWSNALLAAVAGAVVNSLANTGTLFLSGTPISLKAVGVAAGTAALTTAIGYLRKSPIPISIDEANDHIDAK